MDETLVDRFYDLLTHSSLLILDRVKYSNIQNELPFFIKDGFISNDDIKVSNDIVNATNIAGKIYKNLNLTSEEDAMLKNRINDYLYNFLMSIYQNADKNILTKKRLDFLKLSLAQIFDIIQTTGRIFGEPLMDFFLRFLKKTGMWYSDECANFVYDKINTSLEENPFVKNYADYAFLYKYIDEELTSRWVKYARVVIERSNTIFGNNENRE